MVDVRELVVRINAVDSATKVVEHITSLINEGNKSSLALKIDEAAINSVKSTIDDLYSSIKAPINIAADTTSADSTIGNFASNAESIVNDTSAFIQESVTSAFDGIVVSDNISSGVEDQLNVVDQSLVQTTTLTETLSAAWSGIGDAAGGAKDTINGMVDSINMASVAIGAVVGLGANRVFQDARLEDAIDEQFRGAQNLEVRKFVDDNSVLMVGDEIKRVLG